MIKILLSKKIEWALLSSAIGFFFLFELSNPASISATLVTLSFKLTLLMLGLFIAKHIYNSPSRITVLGFTVAGIVTGLITANFWYDPTYFSTGTGPGWSSAPAFRQYPLYGIDWIHFHFPGLIAGTGVLIATALCTDLFKRHGRHTISYILNIFIRVVLWCLVSYIAFFIAENTAVVLVMAWPNYLYAGCASTLFWAVGFKYLLMPHFGWKQVLYASLSGGLVALLVHGFGGTSRFDSPDAFFFLSWQSMMGVVFGLLVASHRFKPTHSNTPPALP